MLLPFQAFVIRRLFSSKQYKPPLFHYEDIIEFACSGDDCSSQRARRYLNLRWESARAKTSILRAGLRNVFTCISFGIIFLADIIFRIIYWAGIIYQFYNVNPQNLTSRRNSSARGWGNTWGTTPVSRIAGKRLLVQNHNF